MAGVNLNQASVSFSKVPTACGKVVYLQPKAAHWRDTTAVVHITCSEWLESYGHEVHAMTALAPCKRDASAPSVVSAPALFL
jgi:hypothetical protein